MCPLNQHFPLNRPDLLINALVYSCAGFTRCLRENASCKCCQQHCCCDAERSLGKSSWWPKPRCEVVTWQQLHARYTDWHFVVVISHLCGLNHIGCFSTVNAHIFWSVTVKRPVVAGCYQKFCNRPISIPLVLVTLFPDSWWMYNMCSLSSFPLWLLKCKL